MSLACLGSGVLQLGDSLLFSSLDLSAKTKFDGDNISLVYAQHYVYKFTYIVLNTCTPCIIITAPQDLLPGFRAACGMRWWYGLYLGLSLPMEHRPSTTLRQRTLFWAVLAAPV